MFVSIRKMAKRYSATEAAQKTLEIESEVESEESEYGQLEDEEFTAEMYAVLLLIYSKTLKV